MSGSYKCLGSLDTLLLLEILCSRTTLIGSMEISDHVTSKCVGGAWVDRMISWAHPPASSGSIALDGQLKSRGRDRARSPKTVSPIARKA